MKWRKHRFPEIQNCENRANIDVWWISQRQSRDDVLSWRKEDSKLGQTLRAGPKRRSAAGERMTPFWSPLDFLPEARCPWYCLFHRLLLHEKPTNFRVHFTIRNRNDALNESIDLYERENDSFTSAAHLRPFVTKASLLTITMPGFLISSPVSSGAQLGSPSR